MSQDKKNFYADRKRALYIRWLNYHRANDYRQMERIHQRIIRLNAAVAQMRAA